MRKFHNLKLLRLVTILAVALIFVGINLVLAGGKGKNYTWKAVILTESVNLAGEIAGEIERLNEEEKGWMYEDSEEFVNVSAGMGWCMSGARKPTRYYYPNFAFEVNYPTKIQFKDMFLDYGGCDTKLEQCGFPTGGVWPSCLEYFLNSKQQPMEGYKRVLFSFSGSCCTNQEDADINNMEIGVPMQIRLRFFIEGQDLYGSCEECYKYNYHCVRGVAHGYTNPNYELPFDIYLVRMDTDTWKIVVNTDFDNPNYSNSSYPEVFDYQNDMISEEYCECEEVPFKGKKIRYKKHIRHSAWTRGHMEFQIKFIRTRK